MYGLEEILKHVAAFRENVAFNGDQAYRLLRKLQDDITEFVETEQVAAKLENRQGPKDIAEALALRGQADMDYYAKRIQGLGTYVNDYDDGDLWASTLTALKKKKP